jgi:predicted ABC-type ATPase
LSERVVSRRQLWLLVGGNGAGKSTFHRLFLEPLGLPFVNADNLAKLIAPDTPEAHGLEAALLAEQQRESLLLRGFSFCFETVYSHPSKVDFVARAKALGYEMILVLIHLNNAFLNQARIAQRISEGGHHVPAEKVISRIPRLLKNVKASLPLCDQVRLVDNSSAEHPFLPGATIIAGLEQRHQDPLPDWVLDLIS